MTVRILRGDVRDRLRDLPDESVHCVVTSPPYWGLRDYGDPRQIGLEATPQEYVERLVSVFREARRVLRDDGTLWLNLADTFKGRRLVGMPWRVAFALTDDGWVLRSEVIWSKRNGLPEGSANDRPHRFHEHIFMLTKRERGYYFDADAIREASDPAQEAHNRRYAKRYENHAANAVGRHPGNENHVGIHSRPGKGGRAKRSVWTTSVARTDGQHSATWPVDLVEPMILAGCPVGGAVLDPFGGAGTTGLVAARLQRNATLIELNPAYADMAERRINADAPLLAAAD